MTVQVADPLSPTTLINQVDIVADDGSATAQETTEVVADPVLQITKGDSPDPVQAGAQLTYTLNYSNTGSGQATSVVITETYDSNVTFVSATPAPDGVTDNQWTIGTLASGGSGSISITVQVKKPLPNGTQLSNSAELTSDQGSALGEQVTTVQSSTALNITKVHSADPVKPGQDLTYTITYSNSSTANETATNVVITETYDTNVTFKSAVPSPDSGTDNQWTIIDLAPGDSGTITVTVKVKTPLPNGTQLLNTVLIESDQGTANSQKITTVQSNPVLSINKTHSVDPVKPGENLTYTITYSNSSGASETATNVVITETYDPNVTFVSASPTPEVGNNNQWTIGTLAPGNSGTITVTVKVKNPLPDGTLLLNTVDMSSDQNSSTSQEITTVQSNPVLAINKTSSPYPVEPGGILTYTITYSNSGSTDATNVVITETYDPNVTFVSASSTPDVGNNNPWTIGTLTSGASGSIEIKVRVNGTLTSGTLLFNSVTVTSDQGSSIAENVTPVKSVTPIPTMNEWGMIIFALLSVCTGLWILRKRGEI